jgi:hypothetical protein
MWAMPSVWCACVCRRVRMCTCWDGMEEFAWEWGSNFVCTYLCVWVRGSVKDCSGHRAASGAKLQSIHITRDSNKHATHCCRCRRRRRCGQLARLTGRNAGGAPCLLLPSGAPFALVLPYPSPPKCNINHSRGPHLQRRLCGQDGPELGLTQHALQHVGLAVPHAPAVDLRIQANHRSSAGW